MGEGLGPALSGEGSELVARLGATGGLEGGCGEVGGLFEGLGITWDGRRARGGLRCK